MKKKIGKIDKAKAQTLMGVSSSVKSIFLISFLFLFLLSFVSALNFNTDADSTFNFPEDNLDGYNSNYFMPLNTSVVGNFSFNGLWNDGGVSIIDGDIYAQTGYFYNITALDVTRQNVTFIDDVTFNNDLLVNGDLDVDGTITGTFSGNSSIWSRAGTNTFLTNIGDNVGIGTTSPTGLLDVNGKLVVKTDGNVGIGTTSPGYSLDVNAGTGNNIANFESTDTTGRIRIADNTGEGYILAEGDTISLATSSSIHRGLTLLDNGKVGIGTTSPKSKLDVNGAVYLKGKQILDSDGTHSYFKSESSTMYFYTAGSIAGSFSGNNLGVVGTGTFGTNAKINGAGDSYFNGGNVGIGTTSPGANLEVNGGNDNTTLTIGSDDANIHSSTLRVTEFLTNYDTLGGYLKYNGANDRISLGATGADGIDDDFLIFIRDIGNIGIGLDTPGEKLSVAGNVMIGDTAWSEGTTTGDLAIQGNVGIGTTSPDTILDVNGAITTRELSSDPADPDEGANVKWQSDGTGAGDDGDIMMKITAGGVTKTITIIDFSVA